MMIHENTCNAHCHAALQVAYRQRKAYVVHLRKISVHVTSAIKFR